MYKLLLKQKKAGQGSRSAGLYKASASTKQKKTEGQELEYSWNR
jgi:hypothetical protein